MEKKIIERRLRAYRILMIVFLVLFFVTYLLLFNYIREAYIQKGVAKEFGEMFVFSAKLMNHCAEINNMTIEEVTNSYLHKMVDEELEDKTEE